MSQGPAGWLPMRYSFQLHDPHSWAEVSVSAPLSEYEQVPKFLRRLVLLTEKLAWALEPWPVFSSTIESAGHFSGQPSSYIGNGYSLANRLPDLRPTQLSPFFLSLEIDGLSRSSPLKPLY